jgi:hypothetical protein
LSGFELAFVGLNVGKFDLPDKSCLFGFNVLHAICRVCRVSSTGESSGGFRRLECKKPLGVI